MMQIIDISNYKNFQSVTWVYPQLLSKLFILYHQVRMHYGSGTVDRIASRQPADAPGNRQMLHVHSSDGSTFLGETMSWPQSWKYDIILEMQLYQLMHIYLKNNSA